MTRHTTIARLHAATRIAFGPFYVAPAEDGWGVWDARARRGSGCLADDMPFAKAVAYAHERYLGSTQARSGKGERT